MSDSETTDPMQFPQNVSFVHHTQTVPMHTVASLPAANAADIAASANVWRNILLTCIRQLCGAINAVSNMYCGSLDRTLRVAGAV